MTGVCALSGEPMEQPVASLKSGHVFEKRVILSYIEDHKADPFTKEPLTEADLLAIKGDRKLNTRTPTATSIPALLSLFQNEWDAAMLETFELKRQYQAVRQELAQALYQQDAACRVIARLMKERDEARAALENIVKSTGSSQRMDVEESTAPAAAAAADEADASKYALPAAVVETLDDTFTALSTGRRKRKMPPGLVTPETMGKLSAAEAFASPFPKAHPAVDLLRVSALDDTIIAAANGSSIKILSKEDPSHVISSLQGKGAHKEAVTCLEFHPEQHMLVSGSADRTLKTWAADESGKKWTLSDTLETEFEGAIVGLSIHPSGEYAAAASADGTWALFDLPNAKEIVRVRSGSGKEVSFAASALHPDGVLLATGCTDGRVLVWDMKNGSVVATFEGHRSAVNRMVFSENGYILVTSAGADTVRVWDLRKLSCVKELNEDGAEIVDLDFEKGGQYLALLTASTLSVHVTKVWTKLADVEVQDARSCRFADFASSRMLLVGAKKDVKRVETPGE